MRAHVNTCTEYNGSDTYASTIMVKIYQNTIFTLLKTNQTQYATLIPMASFDILDLHRNF